MPTDPLAGLLELDGVAAAERRARAAVDSVLRHPALRRRAPDVAAESALRSAWASAALAGAEVSLAELRAGQVADPVVQGALRVQSAIGLLADTWPRAPRQALARLHALAAADLSDADALGRPTARPEVADRLDVLATVLVDSAAPATVLAAVVHGELLALDAFAPVSGLVARAAAGLTQVARGLDPRGLVPVDVGHLQSREDYLESLAGFRDGTPAGLARWLLHCADAVVHGARESLAICEAIVRG